MDESLSRVVYVVSIGNEIDGRIVWTPESVSDNYQASVDHARVLRRYGRDGYRVAFVRMDTYGHLAQGKFIDVS